MENKSYELVTVAEDFGSLPHNVTYKNFTAQEKLIISKTKPDIQQLVKIIIQPEISSYEIISTIQGSQLVIQGNITEKIFYVADKPEQAIHCSEFSFSFANYIKLPQNPKIKRVKVTSEDAIIQLINKRKINQWILLIFCLIPALPQY
ncbi:DUF3794 domain-containing protein [Halanaerobaculum tunisiense]